MHLDAVGDECGSKHLMDDRIPRFRYRELAPPTSLSGIISCFFEFVANGSGGEKIPHVVIPDGCISILCRFNRASSERALLIKGLDTEPFRTIVDGADCHWGVKISPAAARAVFGCPPESLKTGPVLNRFPKLTTGLADPRVKCFEDFAAVLVSRFEKLGIDSSTADPVVSGAVRSIAGSAGEIKVSEVANLVGLSPRQLTRRFRSASGLTPKQFARFCRLRATGISLLDSDISWAQRAAELGFTDQAHLARELAALTGDRPREFEERLARTDHSMILK